MTEEFYQQEMQEEMEANLLAEWNDWKIQCQMEEVCYILNTFQGSNEDLPF